MAPRALASVLALALGAAIPFAPAVALAEAAPCEPGPVLLLDGLGTPEQELVRLAELSGLARPDALLLDRAGARVRRLCAGAERLGWMGRAGRTAGGEAEAETVAGVTSTGLAWLPVRLGTVWNSTHPTSGPDGLLWAGRGFSATATAGLAVRAGPLSAALAPEMAWQQNRWFALAPTGLEGDAAYASPWYPDELDLPQRFGAGPFTSVAPGRSFVRLDAFGVAAGLSTESRWWGPGQRNALLLSGAGPGFPHLFLGTSEPVDFGIGPMEAQLLWGRLDRTPYRSPGVPRHAWLSGLALTWAPRWVDGLSVGLGRMFIQSWESLRADHFLSVVESPFKTQVAGGDNPFDNQLVSVWGRWVVPVMGLALWAELARDDFPLSLAAAVREPDNTLGYLLGLEKLVPAGARTVRVLLELTSLTERRPAGELPLSFYTHPRGVDATHRGQLLGSIVGPGGDGQYLAVDVLGPEGRWGLWLERIRRNDDVFLFRIDPAGRESQRDAELTGGFRQLLFAGPVEVDWHVAAAYRWNRDFLKSEPNLQVGFTVALPLQPPRQPPGGAGP